MTDAQKEEQSNNQSKSPARKRSPLELLMALFPEHAAENIQVCSLDTENFILGGNLRKMNNE